MLQRLKRLLRRNREPQGFKWTGWVKAVDQDPSIEMRPISITREQLEEAYRVITENLELQNNGIAFDPNKIEGDGKAEFLPELTEEEVLEEERQERLGWKHFKLPWQK